MLNRAGDWSIDLYACSENEEMMEWLVPRPKHATRLVHGSFDGHTDGETDGNVHLADGKARRIVSRVVKSAG